MSFLQQANALQPLELFHSSNHSHSSNRFHPDCGCSAGCVYFTDCGYPADCGCPIGCVYSTVAITLITTSTPEAVLHRPVLHQCLEFSKTRSTHRGEWYRRCSRLIGFL